MNFTLKRILQKLFNRKRLYLSIVIQIAIGIVILNIFFNLSLKINIQLMDLLKENKNQEFYISASYKDDQIFSAKGFDILSWQEDEPELNEYSDVPFPSSYLDLLKNQYPDAKFELETMVPMVALNVDSIEEYYICYNSNYDTVNMSKEFYDNVKASNSFHILTKREFPFQLIEHSLVTLDGKEIPIEFLSENNNITYIPIQIYDALYHPKNLINTKLKLRIDSVTQNTINTIHEMIEVLENDIFLYHINSEFYDVLGKVSTAYEQAVAFNFIGAVLFIILMIGFSGLFTLVINTRKKEIAISLALGSTKKKLYFECLLELLCLSLFGCFIGSLVSLIVLMQGVSYATVTITPSLFVMLVGVFISALVAFIATIPSFYIIKRLMPMEILRTE